jgi:hypothetical protein
MFVATNNTQLYVFNTSSLTVKIYFIKRTIRYTHVQFKIIKMKNKKYHTVRTFPKSIAESYK